MTTQEQLEKIKNLLRSAEKEFAKINISDQQDIFESHNEDDNLPYHIRKGFERAEELIERQIEEDDDYTGERQEEFCN